MEDAEKGRGRKKKTQDRIGGRERRKSGKENNQEFGGKVEKETGERLQSNHLPF